MTSYNHYSFALSTINLAHTFAFTITNYQAVVPSTYSHQSFWNEFFALHKPANEIELAEYLLDLCRCHFSPNQANWPGMDVNITMTAPPATAGGTETVTNHRFTLQKGVSKLKAFVRGKGSKFSYTHACIATSAIFTEVFLSNAEGISAAMSIPGNNNGFTQFFSMLDGWTLDDQNRCEASFERWVTDNGLKARDAAITAQAKKGARALMGKRGTMQCALSFKDVMRVLTGVASTNERIGKPVGRDTIP